MHERTNIRLSAAERSELEGGWWPIATAHRSTLGRAKIILLTANAHGTAEIMRGHRQDQDGDLALAGTVRRGRRSGALARQDASLARSA